MSVDARLRALSLSAVLPRRSISATVAPAPLSHTRDSLSDGQLHTIIVNSPPAAASTSMTSRFFQRSSRPEDTRQQLSQKLTLDPITPDALRPAHTASTSSTASASVTSPRSTETATTTPSHSANPAPAEPASAGDGHDSPLHPLKRATTQLPSSSSGPVSAAAERPSHARSRSTIIDVSRLPAVSIPARTRLPSTRPRP